MAKCLLLCFYNITQRDLTHVGCTSVPNERDLSHAGYTST